MRKLLVQVTFRMTNGEHEIVETALGQGWTFGHAVHDAEKATVIGRRCSQGYWVTAAEAQVQDKR